MNCLDTSALIDYLEGTEPMARFLEENEQFPLFAPAIALHEVYVGAARLRGKAGVTDARENLDWAEPLELSDDAAAEAALIDAELHAKGNPIGAMDTLIAGMVRENGGTLVTRDNHFEHVNGLDVKTY